MRVLLCRPSWHSFSCTSSLLVFRRKSNGSRFLSRSVSLLRNPNPSLPLTSFSAAYDHRVIGAEPRNGENASGNSNLFHISAARLDARHSSWSFFTLRLFGENVERQTGNRV